MIFLSHYQHVISSVCFLNTTCFVIKYNSFMFNKLALIVYKVLCCILQHAYFTTNSICCVHYSDIIMGVMVSQITSLTIVYSEVYSSADPRKHQSPVSLAFVQGIHW